MTILTDVMGYSPQTSQAQGSIPGLLRGGPRICDVEVRVLISESHNLTSNATKIPLESGALVTDHVIVDPNDVSVVFAMTNTASGTAEARDRFETFKKMRDNRDLLQLITEHHMYDNMVIIGISPMHQAPFKGAFECTLRLQQINFVALAVVGRQAVNMDGKTAKTAAAAENGGKQNAIQFPTLALGLKQAISNWLNKK